MIAFKFAVLDLFFRDEFAGKGCGFEGPEASEEGVVGIVVASVDVGVVVLEQHFMDKGIVGEEDGDFCWGAFHAGEEFVVLFVC